MHRVEDIGAKTPQAFCNLVLADPKRCANAAKRLLDDGDDEGKEEEDGNESQDDDTVFGGFEDQDVELHAGHRCVARSSSHSLQFS